MAFILISIDCYENVSCNHFSLFGFSTPIYLRVNVWFVIGKSTGLKSGFLSLSFALICTVYALWSFLYITDFLFFFLLVLVLVFASNSFALGPSNLNDISSSLSLPLPLASSSVYSDSSSWIPFSLANFLTFVSVDSSS